MQVMSQRDGCHSAQWQQLKMKVLVGNSGWEIYEFWCASSPSDETKFRRATKSSLGSAGLQDLRLCTIQHSSVSKSVVLTMTHTDLEFKPVKS
jgi:hypothetical protein